MQSSRRCSNLRDGNQDQTSYNGSLRLLYDMEYSTLPFKWEIYANADTDFSRGGNDEDSTMHNSNAVAWTTVQKYLNGRDKTFVYGRLDLGLRDLQDGEDNDPYSNVSAGIGYGRITTATPLMEAYRCIEDLKKYNIISEEPSDETYLKLAEIIAKESEYKSQYSLKEYEKYWYEAMEEVLKPSMRLPPFVLTIPTMGTMKMTMLSRPCTSAFPIPFFNRC